MITEHDLFFDANSNEILFDAGQDNIDREEEEDLRRYRAQIQELEAAGFTGYYFSDSETNSDSGEGDPFAFLDEDISLRSDEEDG